MNKTKSNETLHLGYAEYTQSDTYVTHEVSSQVRIS